MPVVPGESPAPPCLRPHASPRLRPHALSRCAAASADAGDRARPSPTPATARALFPGPTPVGHCARRLCAAPRRPHALPGGSALLPAGCPAPSNVPVVASAPSLDAVVSSRAPAMTVSTHAIHVVGRRADEPSVMLCTSHRAAFLQGAGNDDTPQTPGDHEPSFVTDHRAK